MEKETEDLLVKSQWLVQEIKKLKGYSEYLKAYVYSSKKRDILFKISAPIDREKETSKILNLFVDMIVPMSQGILQRTRIYLELLKKQGVIKQDKRHKEAVKYTYNAIAEEEILVKAVIGIKELVIQLKDENITYKKMKSISDDLKKYFDQWDKAASEVESYIAYFEGCYRIERYITQNGDELEKYNLYYPQRMQYLKTGDIFISFKTMKYLKIYEGIKFSELKVKDPSSKVNAFVARTSEAVSLRISDWIHRFTDSQVTHVALYIQTDPKNPESGKLFHSYGGSFGFRELDMSLGTLWIVLRPKLNSDQRMKLFSILREKYTENVRMTFSSFIGVFVSGMLSNFVNFFSRKHVHINNVMANAKAKAFCSQFLNQVFKEAGFYLTPKSKYSGMVFPSDVAASKDVEFVGVLFDASTQESKEMILSEFAQGVRV